MMKAIKKLQKRALVTPTADKLRRWNLWLGGLFALQALAVLVLSAERTFSVHLSFVTVDRLQSQASGDTVIVPALHRVFEVNLACLLVLILGLAAISHLLMARYRRRYEAQLQSGVNYLRWVEYAITGGLIVVAVGLLCGVYDVASLALLFAMSTVIGLLGLILEQQKPIRGRATFSWLSFMVAMASAAVVWLVLALYLGAAVVYGSGGIPTFVYWLYGSMLVLLAAFATTMYAYLRNIGPWKNYLYVERQYMLLSLLTKSLLVWLVFAGALLA